MSYEQGTYLFFLLFLPLMIGYGFHRDFRYEKLVNEKEAVDRPGSGRRTAGYLSPMLGPVYLLATLTTYFLFMGWQAGLVYTGEILGRGMLVVLVYYPLLLLILPLLRRVVSARCCAVLGTLPAFLFAFGFLTNLIQLWPPKIAIRLPRGLPAVLIVVWLAGAGAVLLWKAVEHRYFRHVILGPAWEVTDEETLELWDYEQQRIERPKDKPIPLAISPTATSPVTIGLFASTQVTALPDRTYTQEELELIFRHELRHVQRLDSSTKLFYTVCLAFCWFYPPMWLVYRNATADLELSCDEMVLDRADEGRREQYARLLLSQAGDDRGFSTCLSGSAKALEHRLKNILHPRRRLEGAVLVTLTMVALLALGSSVAVTDTYGTVGELVLDRLPPAQLSAGYEGDEWDEEAVLEALNGLEVTRLSGFSHLPDGTRIAADFGFDCRPERDITYWLLFTEDGYLSVNGYHYPRGLTEVRGLYRVEGEVDWEALRRTE